MKKYFEIINEFYNQNLIVIANEKILDKEIIKCVPKKGITSLPNRVKMKYVLKRLEDSDFKLFKSKVDLLLNNFKIVDNIFTIKCNFKKYEIEIEYIKDQLEKVRDAWRFKIELKETIVRSFDLLYISCL